MKPNLLNFANNVLLSADRRGAYNLNTGEQSPDTGYFVGLLEEGRSNVSPETIREFWRENSQLLANEHLWLGIWHDGERWMYGVAELVEDRETAIFKGISRGSGVIVDNSTGEFIELPLPQTKGTEWQRQTYAKLETQKILTNAN